MPTQRQITETYWSVCWWGFVPYPCRKTRTVTKWCYDFSYFTYDYHYVYTNYRGCEYNNLYSWRQWELSLSSGASTLYFVTKCYDTQRPRTGPCTPDTAIARAREVLGERLVGRTNEGSDEAR
ncbi:hypothetical protein [Micromonospora sp. NPDC005806]|uniref:hypothetical protein n=1 Tax=Micromonospora sp. NPDC005806 TaxID=3364234 RepID=UPI0036B81909